MCGRSRAILHGIQVIILASKGVNLVQLCQHMLYTAQLVLASVCHLVTHILGKRMRLEEARLLMQVSGALETRLKTMSHCIYW